VSLPQVVARWLAAGRFWFVELAKCCADARQDSAGRASHVDRGIARGSRLLVCIWTRDWV